MTRNGWKMQRLTAALTLAATTALAPAQRTAAEADESAIEKLPPDTRAVLESISPTRAGDDGDRGIDLVNREWELTVGNAFIDGGIPTSVDQAKTDVEGNVVTAGVTFNNGFQLQITKLDGSLNGDAPPTGPIWQIELPGEWNLYTTQIEIDLNGFIYALADLTTGSESVLFKIAPTGGTPLWSAVIHRYFGRPSLVLDPDGTPFIATIGDPSVYTISTGIVLRRIDSLTGVIAWVTFIEGADAGDGTCYAESRGPGSPKITTDKRGDLWVTTTDNFGSLGRQFVWQVDAISGEVLQCGKVEVPDAPVLTVHDFIVAPDGRLLSVGRDGGLFPGTTSYLSILTKNLSQAPFFQIGGLGAYQFTTLEADRMGRVHAMGVSTDRLYAKYMRLSPGLGVQSLSPNTAPYRTNHPQDPPAVLAIDRIGNPYITVRNPVSPGTLRTFKLDGSNNGADIVWDETTEFQNTTDARPADLVVDAGSNVYSVMTGDTGGSGLFAGVVKHSQPFTGVPRLLRSYPDFGLDGESIWHPSIPSFDFTQEFFDTSWNASPFIGESFSVPFAGDFGGGLDVDFSGAFGVGFKAEASLGDIDISIPTGVQFLVPPMNKLVKGLPVTVLTDWDLDPAASMATNAAPSLDAGITGFLSASLSSEIFVEAFSEDFIDVQLINAGFAIPTGYVPGLHLNSLLGPQIPPGTWVEVSDPRGFFTADARYPEFAAQGVFAQDSGGGFGASAVSTIDERFLTLSANITEMIAAATGITTSKGDGINTSVLALNYNLAVAQLVLRNQFNATQTIDVDFTPMITYRFSDGIPDQTLRAGEPLTFDFPQDLDVVVTPTVHLNATLTNQTGIKLIPGVSFKPIDVSANAKFDIGVDTVDLFSFSTDDLIPNVDEDIAEIDITLYDNDWSLDFGEIELPPFHMAGNPSTPILEGASREFATMLIYNQTNPLPAGYNVLTSGAIRMLLYGDRLDNPSLQVHMQHRGARVLLDHTIINTNTVLVEIPNYMRVVPGVARIWATVVNLSEVRVSETLDFPIEYPRPRLDTVNPNLWAADPAMLEIPVSVIDGRSTLGQDTFIARRDYFLKLRDELWDSSRVSGMSIDAFFSDFDFNQVPAFPMVLFDGKPLPRFEQPTDSGVLNLRLPTSNYDRPRVLDVVICNPGPGGGLSRVKQLNIAAPLPVLSSLEPASVRPDGGPFRLRVTGPVNVPYWNGFEEPKFGNLTHSSVVRINGVDVPTTFLNSSVLEADVSPSHLSAGFNIVTVYTPANSSVYFEQIVDGGGNIVFQGEVPSGGESVPLFLDVSYPRPVVTQLSPDSTLINSPAMLDTERAHNVSIIGTSFTPASVVYVNGQPRATQFETETLVRVMLEPQDLASAGFVQISVETEGGVSFPSLLEIRSAP